MHGYVKPEGSLEECVPREDSDDSVSPKSIRNMIMRGGIASSGNLLVALLCRKARNECRSGRHKAGLIDIDGVMGS